MHESFVMSTIRLIYCNVFMRYAKLCVTITCTMQLKYKNK